MSLRPPPNAVDISYKPPRLDIQRALLGEIVGVPKDLQQAERHRTSNPMVENVFGRKAPRRQGCFLFRDAEHRNHTSRQLQWDA